MTEEQINKKALEAYPLPPLYNEEQRRSKAYADSYARARDQQDGYCKALSQIEELPKIKGWVARDYNGLYLTKEKPFRNGYIAEWAIKREIPVLLDECDFPELTWESEPIEVELLIRKI